MAGEMLLILCGKGDGGLKRSVYIIIIAIILILSGLLLFNRCSAPEQGPDEAEQAGLSMPQMAIAWVLRNQNVASAIVGASRPEQLEATVSAADLTVDDDLAAAIDEVLGDRVATDPARTETPKTRP